MENMYVQFDDMVYKQIVGIPMGTNRAPLIADLFLYCNERDFMSNLQKSKRFDLIDKFDDTSRYLDDISTIDNTAFAEHIPDIYPREIRFNKANTSDKESSLLDWHIKVIGNNIHTSVYDKREDFGFPIVNFPWLSGDVPRLLSYGIYISQLVRFARWCTNVLISILNIFKSLQTYFAGIADITSFGTRLESSLGPTRNFCPNLVQYRFKNMNLWSRVGARTGTLKNPTKCLWRWEPDRRSNFFFSPPAHLCAVTYMTEISLIVTLNNQFTHSLI